ncbi:MAG: Flp pilus assembly complex ATPase component TadA, partial [Candidatus Nomurabacteria bacterium]|nr:Flp pilus assembly complex ATPase component TadA [Candidatus Nomurabacteria bacterium]
MDGDKVQEDKRQQRFRDAEETATAGRAELLGLEYLDLRNDAATRALADGVMETSDMYKFRMAPLAAGDNSHPALFGVTTSTPESHVREMIDDYGQNARTVQFVLISDSSWRALMQRYDPPKKVSYDDVEITKEGDSDTIAKVSQTFESVRSDDILNYLIQQADQLGASDIHLENQRDNVRVRFRIDGTLHPVATLTHDKYRILFAAIASAANISTAATESQTGHIVREVGAADARHILNMRIETVPTVYGEDAVLRLFNFDQSMLNLDRLGLDEDEMKILQDVISHPRGMVMVVGPTGSGKSTTLYSILNAL